MVNNHEITIGIPSGGRLTKLNNCIDSIISNTTVPYNILIIDNGTSPLNQNSISRNDVEINIVSNLQQMSPSESRQYIFYNAKTDYIFFIDEDMEVTSQSINIFFNILNENSHIDIIGGYLKENFYEYPIGYYIGTGLKNNTRGAWKEPISRRRLVRTKILIYKVDFMHPPFLVRKNIINKVNFDDNYKWGSELFDFFFQCKINNIQCYVNPLVKFLHYPGKYKDTTFNNNREKNNYAGRIYFIKKWNIHISNELLATYFDIFFFRLNRLILSLQKFVSLKIFFMKMSLILLIIIYIILLKFL